MKYEVIKGCVIKGAGHQVGSVVDLDDETLVKSLMSMKRLIPYAEPEKTIDRSIGLSEDEPKPKKRAKK
jgi:hypothetical protein